MHTYVLICHTLIVMSGVNLIQDTPACCGTTATFRCIVTESTSLTWIVGPFPPVGYASNSFLNTPVRQGDNDEFEFVLVNVQPNPTSFSDFNSTLTVDVGLNDMLDGIRIQCEDIATMEAITLTLETSKYHSNTHACRCTIITKMLKIKGL